MTDVHKATEGLGPIKALCNNGGYQLAEQWINVTCSACLFFKPKSQSVYLAIDPGHTIGWATFDEAGTIVNMGQTPMEHLNRDFDKLLHSDLKAVICEDYKNHPWMKQKGFGRNETSKIIGKLEYLAELRSVRFFLQSNTVLSIGYKWAGLGTAPSNHSISHQYDAVAHGVYWLQSNNIRKPGQAIRPEDK